MWKHFNRKKVCKHCGKRFAYHGGTSNLLSHLKNAHQNLWPTSDKDKDTERTTVSSTKHIDTYVVSDLQKVFSNARSKAITNLVVNWISANSRPINIVEDTGLQQLSEYIEPAYSVLQVTSIVKKRYTSDKKVSCGKRNPFCS